MPLLTVPRGAERSAGRVREGGPREIELEVGNIVTRSTVKQKDLDIVAAGSAFSLNANITSRREAAIAR